MATFKTTINISPEDVKILKSQGYSLYGFKSVAASGDGSPTVWFNLPAEKLLGKTVITWEEEFQAYNSTTTILPKTVIEASNTIDTDLGQRVTIELGSGNLESSSDGIDGAVSFLNNDTQQFTVGINQLVNGQSNILCAFPILGAGSARVITPITKIALIFSTEQVITATVITKAMSAGAFINLTGVTSRETSYSVNAGWSAGGGTWLKNFDAFTDLKKLLIENTNKLEKSISEKFAV
ncbi:hypothetical protein [Flavobacterium ginsenosidimutans]|uniref:Uncharacterized protein n=1 Tax=Flavobacterium ginsenosidimutans TaxID=687844 RepID=A0ABZ2Q8K7_9FLAO|nr:hypothetical protein [Flavobacterium ginsenosidimutans]KAF2334076.1 hypothetical protein DM444_06570 [Flavobacterium ginsenosidimutans]